MIFRFNPGAAAMTQLRKYYLLVNNSHTTGEE